MINKFVRLTSPVMLFFIGLVLGGMVVEVAAQAIYNMNNNLQANRVTIFDTSGNTVDVDGSNTVTAVEAVTTAITAMNADLEPACDESVVISTASSGNNELIAGQSGQVIKICGGVVIAEGTVVVQFVKGDDAACATGETNLTGAMSLKVDGTQPPGFTVPQHFMNAASDYYCIELSTAVQVSGVISYTQYTP